MSPVLINFADPKRKTEMNWIILIFAGMMEVAFTFCLGKTKTTVGPEQYWWWGGFLAALSLSMYLMAKAAKTIPIGTVYPVTDRHRSCRSGACRHLLFQRADKFLANLFHHDPDYLDSRA